MTILKKAESQFLLAFVSLVLLASCSGYNATASDWHNENDNYSYLFTSNNHDIKFHSYGGRYLAHRIFYRKYGELVFTYYDRLRQIKKEKGNDVYYSLFVVKHIPEEVRRKNDTVTVKLYNKEVISFSENDRKGRKKIYKRYFTFGDTNYLFVGEYKRFYKDQPAIYERHMSQEMEGLEL
ncbi:hypothetical protein [uncultured Chryseobacterium sp.]|uniref:hypothetical protein n=1 Tax=uncultured Chryseobacterium sp. TaxID=259322 RepID=UPI0025D4C1C5|nr:hypothetical protein [uncultured Chryseobacterium sp.]